VCIIKFEGYSRNTTDFILFRALSMAANIVSHCMAKGQRVLTTSKSLEAFNVIRDKIKDEVFEDGDQMHKLIMSWGNHLESCKSFSSAIQQQRLQLQAHSGHPGISDHEREMTQSQNSQKEHTDIIELLEVQFRVESAIAGKNLREMAEFLAINEKQQHFKT